jgi:hypothetical protein
VYDTNPTKAINSWKESWESAKAAANLQCRFHDLRDTAVTRMLDGGIGLPVVASILGGVRRQRFAWRSGMVNIGQVAQRQAVSLLEHVPVTKTDAVTCQRAAPELDTVN